MLIERKKVDINGQLTKSSLYDIQVDAKSEEQLKKLLSWSKNMLGNLRSKEGFYSKNAHSKDVFDACNRIYNTDITHLYEEGDLNQKYYVYAHCDPNHKVAIGKHGITTFAATLGLTHRPFYIGKGQNNRAYELDRNDSHRKYRQKIQKSNKDVVVQIIKEELTEVQALAIESKLIDIFGLIVDRGYLVNLDEGKNNKIRRSLYTNDLMDIGRYSINTNVR
jgi:hypothetical protein